MNKLTLLIILSLLLVGCQNSFETCVDYCMDEKDTSGYTISEAWQKLNIAHEQCSKECRLGGVQNQ